MGDNVLLIEDDPAEAEALIRALADPRAGSYTVEWVKLLAEGLQRLKSGGISLILLDLFLPDSQGVKTLDKLLRAAPRVPVLVLSGLADEDTAEQACQRGAKDYLLRDHRGGYPLPHTLRNVIARVSSEKASCVEAERARVTLDSIGDAVLSTDVTGNVTYLNRIAEALTGWSSKEAVGRPLAEVFKIIDGVTRELAPDPMEHAIRANATVGLTMNCVLIRRDGQESAIEDAAAPIRDGDGELTGAVIFFRDVNAARALALKMSHLAQHDALTDLPNRSLLTQQLIQAIALAGRHDRQVAVLFLDLDHFKNINDTLGHAIGDKLLQSVGERLQGCVRQSDTICRQSGDEFIVLLSEIGGRADAISCARKILTAVSATDPIDGNDITIGSSIGISVFPHDGQDAGVLLKAADTAMYYAKEQGRNQYQCFNREMKARTAPARGIHPHRRGLRPDRADRAMGLARSVPANQSLARRGFAAGARRGQRFRTGVSLQEPSRRPSNDSQRNRLGAALSRTRTHRKRAHRGRRGDRCHARRAQSHGGAAGDR